MTANTEQMLSGKSPADTETNLYQ